jgi:ribosomal protein S27AE
MPDNNPLRCPRCDNYLTRQKAPSGFRYVCDKCHGLAINIPVLQHERVTDEFIKNLWKATRKEGVSRERRCPHCSKLMAEIKARLNPAGDARLCQSCQTFGLTPTTRYASAQAAARPRKTACRKKPVTRAGGRSGSHERKIDSKDHRPFSWSKTIGTILDFPAEDNDTPIIKPPYITWGIITFVIFIFIISLTEKSNFAFEYGLVPYMGDWIWTGASRGFYSTILSIIPLIYTLYFLLIFGDNAESKLGKIRFLLLVILSHGVGLLAAHLVYPIKTARFRMRRHCCWNNGLLRGGISGPEYDNLLVSPLVDGFGKPLAQI